MDVQTQNMDPQSGESQSGGKMRKGFKLFGKRKPGNIFSIRSKGDGNNKSPVTKTENPDGLPETSEHSEQEPDKENGQEVSQGEIEHGEEETLAEDGALAAAHARASISSACSARSLSFLSLFKGSRRGGGDRRVQTVSQPVGRKHRGLKGLFNSVKFRSMDKVDKEEAPPSPLLMSSRTNSVEIIKEDLTLTPQSQPRSLGSPKSENCEPVKSLPDSAGMTPSETIPPQGTAGNVSTSNKHAPSSPTSDPPLVPGDNSLSSLLADISSLLTFDSISGGGDIMADVEAEWGKASSAIGAVGNQVAPSSTSFYTPLMSTSVSTAKSSPVAAVPTAASTTSFSPLRKTVSNSSATAKPSSVITTLTKSSTLTTRSVKLSSDSSSASKPCTSTITLIAGKPVTHETPSSPSAPDKLDSASNCKLQISSSQSAAGESKAPRTISQAGTVTLLKITSVPSTTTTSGSVSVAFSKPLLTSSRVDFNQIPPSPVTVPQPSSNLTTATKTELSPVSVPTTTAASSYMIPTTTKPIPVRVSLDKISPAPILTPAFASHAVVSVVTPTTPALGQIPVSQTQTYPASAKIKAAVSKDSPAPTQMQVSQSKAPLATAQFPASVSKDPSAQIPVSVSKDPPAQIPASVSKDPPARFPVSVSKEPPAQIPVSVSKDPPPQIPVSVSKDPPAQISGSVSKDPPPQIPVSKAQIPGSVSIDPPARISGSVSKDPPPQIPVSQGQIPGSVSKDPPARISGSVSKDPPPQIPVSQAQIPGSVSKDPPAQIPVSQAQIPVSQAQIPGSVSKDPPARIPGSVSKDPLPQIPVSQAQIPVSQGQIPGSVSKDPPARISGSVSKDPPPQIPVSQAQIPGSVSKDPPAQIPVSQAQIPVSQAQIPGSVSKDPPARIPGSVSKDPLPQIPVSQAQIPVSQGQIPGSVSKDPPARISGSVSKDPPAQIPVSQAQIPVSQAQIPGSVSKDPPPQIPVSQAQIPVSQGQIPGSVSKDPPARISGSVSKDPPAQIPVSQAQIPVSQAQIPVSVTKDPPVQLEISVSKDLPARIPVSMSKEPPSQIPMSVSKAPTAPFHTTLSSCADIIDPARMPAYVSKDSPVPVQVSASQFKAPLSPTFAPVLSPPSNPAPRVGETPATAKMTDSGQISVDGQPAIPSSTDAQGVQTVLSKTDKLFIESHTSVQGPSRERRAPHVKASGLSKIPVVGGGRVAKLPARESQHFEDEAWRDPPTPVLEEERPHLYSHDGLRKDKIREVGAILPTSKPTPERSQQPPQPKGLTSSPRDSKIPVKHGAQGSSQIPQAKEPSRTKIPVSKVPVRRVGIKPAAGGSNQIRK